MAPSRHRAEPMFVVADFSGYSTLGGHRMTEDNTLDAMKAAHPWRPIPGCPGRYKLPRTTMSPGELLRMEVTATARQLASTPDPVLVVTFEEGGGLLSYLKGDGSWVHTLNEPEGLRRKLDALGF